MSDKREGSDERDTSRSPSERFDEPDDVLDQDDLSYDAKLDILQRWRAAADNAGDDDGDKRLRRIEQAIHRLQTEVTLDPDKPEEAPSSEGYRPK